jgi:N-acetylglucosaminyldiphosphoundecaprenol N-acetyl-beta-D-mannosaminyltransferase
VSATQVDAPPAGRSSVLDVECFAGCLDSAARTVVDRAIEGSGGYACFGNVHVLVTARHNAPLASALSRSWTTFPDGAPVAWLERRLGARNAERVGGPDLMPLVFELGQEAGLRHFLFGSTPAVLEALERRLRLRYPSAEIVGSGSPPFGQRDPDVDADSVERINATSPHVVWCALGAPNQELWMARWARALSPALVLGVGAAFDFHAGTRVRAPRWMQSAGLEWAHRLYHEPRRLFWRYARTNTEFVVLGARELIRRRGRP